MRCEISNEFSLWWIVHQSGITTKFMTESCRDTEGRIILCNKSSGKITKGEFLVNMGTFNHSTGQ